MPYKDYEKHKENALQNYYKNRDKKLKQVKKYYYKNWDKKRLYNDNWIKNHPEETKIYKKKYANSLKGKTALKKAMENWQFKNKYKTLAHYAIHNALRRGEIIKPELCEKCSQKKYLHAHHYLGYSKKYYLTIKWLCDKCHKEEHYG